MKADRKRRYSLRVRMMVMNMAIAFTALAVCGVLFIVSVSLLVGKYANDDLDFFLTEVSENLNEKTTFMEEIIYRIRDSEEIMNDLNSPGVRNSISHEKMEEIVCTTIDINSEKNLAGWNEPVVESVCLIDRAGNFYPDFYYALIYSDIAHRNSTFLWMNKEFEKEKKKNADYYCRTVDDAVFFAYTIFDDDMSDCGTIVFEVNKDALAEPMEKIMVYKNAFWALLDDTEMIQSGGKPNEDTAEVLEKDPYDSPYNRTYQGMDYRIYKKELGMNLEMVAGIPANQMNMLLYESLKWYILGIAGIVLTGIAGFAFFTYKLTRPMKEVAGKLKEVRKGNFEVKLPEYDSREFHEISSTFNEMTEYINHLIKQVYEKQLSAKEMELKFFQTQMNPHFMFNVLNSIALQAKLDGNEEVFRMLSSFARLIRAKIYRDNHEKVQIRQELEYVRYYLYLQSFRFGDRLKYEIQIEDESYLDFYIPKLCIQLIVENAVVHGIEPKMDNGMVRVKLYKKEESLNIEVTDDGIGFWQEGEILLPIKMNDGDSVHNHVGLNNAHHIIQLMYGEEYGLSVLSCKEKGTTVKIHIPFDSKI